jgi:hypothetical protein
MIVVKIELWPGGDEGRKQDLGTAQIANAVTSTLATAGELGDYTIELHKGRKYSTRGGVWKAGRVNGFPRLRLGPWDLLFRALRDMVGYRNREP